MTGREEAALREVASASADTKLAVGIFLSAARYLHEKSREDGVDASWSVDTLQAAGLDLLGLRGDQP